MSWDYFDRFKGATSYGPPLIHRSGVVDLDGEGHLDFVSGYQGGPAAIYDEESGRSLSTQLLSTHSFISKRAKAAVAR